jgi:cyclic beta-1,2-glucan synthetase
VGFDIVYRYRSSVYQITVQNPHGVSRGVLRARLDGAEVGATPCEIPLVDDGVIHEVTITLG